MIHLPVNMASVTTVKILFLGSISLCVSMLSGDSAFKRKAVFLEVHNPTKTVSSMFHKTFHQCGIDDACNYVVQDVTKKEFQVFNSELEVPSERSNLIIWTKSGIAENLAYKRPSSSSSVHTYGEYTLSASHGNDGDSTGEWQMCSWTKKENMPWWQVDLTKQAAVSSVRIKSGVTNAPLKINPFDISVGDDSSNGGRNNALCVDDGILNAGEFKYFTCPTGLHGRYVTVFLNRIQQLQVCEVEVYGNVIGTL